MRQPEHKTVYLYLTHKCNSWCTFCYRKGFYERNDIKKMGPMDMTEEKALEIIDWCFDNLPNSLLIYQISSITIFIQLPHHQVLA